MPPGASVFQKHMSSFHMLTEPNKRVRNGPYAYCVHKTVTSETLSSRYELYPHDLNMYLPFLPKYFIFMTT